MPAVALVVRADGSIAAADPLLRAFSANQELLEHARRLEAQLVAIDGPCGTNGLHVLPDWSAWAPAPPQGGRRDAEVELAREGVGLFWTTRATIDHFDGASRWIARSLRLFDALPATGAIEVHPHGAFLFLARHAGWIAPLHPKNTPAGRGERLALLERLVPGIDPRALKDHDAVDAACAALVAALHVLGRTKPYGTDAGGGRIWMPDLPRR
jgi:hypothetical protein